MAKRKCEEAGDMEDADGEESRSLRTVKAFSVQCAACYKWRLIPSKEIYEEIRQVVSENPFVCSHACGWKPHAACDDPSDVSHDVNLTWALDKPDIPRAPSGWERLLVFRGQESARFADVYYKSPTGKRLRSLPEVERYLTEHPEYGKAGITKNRFSFLRPTPLNMDRSKKISTCKEVKSLILGNKRE